MYYKLVDKKVTRCATAREWHEWFEAATQSGERFVAQDEVGAIEVSTFFVGADTNSGQAGQLKLFETVVFDKGGKEVAALNAQYKTWNGAAEGHRAVLRKLRNQTSGIE
ncbi:hypothetical protein LMG28614_05686 [Paraburkholderia ultramafica]|uniref:Uncharacterized protein n=1 Tax=Paraburkholderia ultramafica TaxID=1544867 RepID=A0A6S7BU64_9BURK|nr:hypothetical protein [Paraburkholderia ultramafica]CAB3802741.1 hypothetical protein LMG28614_05686 [Paraburkholderia ultramafica]